MRALIKLSMLGGISLLAGCWVQDFEDVSSRDDVSQFNGAVLTLHQEMIAIGVTLDQNYKTGADVIYLVPPPGFSGPEVKERQSIPAGTTVTVTGAVAMPGLIPREQLFFVVTGLQCSFCTGQRVLVNAVKVDGKVQLPKL